MERSVSGFVLPTRSYSTHNRSLTNEEVNTLHEAIKERASSDLGIEIR